MTVRPKISVVATPASLHQIRIANATKGISPGRKLARGMET
jgi:hypothetical protein